MSQINQEIKTIEEMISLYCRKKHHSKEDEETLCKACTLLLNYAILRLHNCPFGEEKGSCRNCQIHCYSPKYRERIRKVMRYAGPRMLLFHPCVYFRKLLVIIPSLRNRKNKL